MAGRKAGLGIRSTSYLTANFLKMTQFLCDFQINSDKKCSKNCSVSAQLCPPQMLRRAHLMVIYKKSYVMLHLETEWISKQNILIADAVLAEPGP